jgi:hypothetical protein
MLAFEGFGKARAPKGEEKAGTLSSGRMSINCAWASKTFLRQRLPLAAHAKHIHDGFEDLPGRNWFSAATGFTIICFSGSRSGEGINGSTFSQKASETSHDLTRAIIPLVLIFGLRE